MWVIFFFEEIKMEYINNGDVNSSVVIKWIQTHGNAVLVVSTAKHHKQTNKQTRHRQTFKEECKKLTSITSALVMKIKVKNVVVKHTCGQRSIKALPLMEDVLLVHG